jgi:hypothetical protein
MYMWKSENLNPNILTGDIIGGKLISLQWVQVVKTGDNTINNVN